MCMCFVGLCRGLSVSRVPRTSGKSRPAKVTVEAIVTTKATRGLATSHGHRFHGAIPVPLGPVGADRVRSHASG